MLCEQSTVGSDGAAAVARTELALGRKLTAVIRATHVIMQLLFQQNAHVFYY
jgi:hypothetical protein